MSPNCEGAQSVKNVVSGRVAEGILHLCSYLLGSPLLDPNAILGTLNPSADLCRIAILSELACDKGQGLTLSDDSSALRYVSNRCLGVSPSSRLNHESLLRRRDMGVTESDDARVRVLLSCGTVSE